MSKQGKRLHIKYLRSVVYVLLGTLLVWLIVREKSNLGQAVDAIKQAKLGWLMLGIAAMFASLPATALVYMALSPKPLRFGRTLLVQTAGFCVNKLLPSGSGAAGTSFLYLRANKVPGVQAGSIVVLNNLLGFVGHFILFWVLIGFQRSALDDLQLKHQALGTSLGLVAAGLMLTVGLIIVLRSKLQRFTKPLKPIVTRPAALGKALAASMLITLCYVVSLLASAEAVGIHMTLATTIIALSASVLATAVVPTPGGIGAAEAGAYAGLIALGVNHQSALAAALLFRVCTFWVPLAVGSAAFAIVARRGYLRAKP